MRVLQVDNLFSLQRLFLCTRYNEFSTKYALLQLASDFECLVQSFVKQDIDPSYCILNCCVIKCSNFEKLNLLLEIGFVLKNLRTLQTSSLRVIDSIGNIKTVSLSIVFNNARLTSKWKSKNEVIVCLMREILKMFVFTNNCIIFPKCVGSSESLGIHCIMIHDTGGICGRTNSSTRVNIVSSLSKIWFELQKPLVCPNPYNAMYKLFKSHCILDRNDTTFSQVSHNILLVGPSGCGKTTLVKSVAFDCGIPIVTILGPEVSSADPGQSEDNIRKLFEEAKLISQEKTGGMCLVFLDQVDALAGKSSTTHSARIVSLVLDQLDLVSSVKRVLVVAATDNPEILVPSIRRPPRLSVELLMGVPSVSEREEILRNLCQKMEVDDRYCKEIAGKTPGFVAADLSLIVLNVQRKISKLCDQADEEETRREWQSVLCDTRPSVLRGEQALISDKAIDLSDIGGLQQPKISLQKAVEWPLFYHDSMKRLGITQSKGVLLYGPPGCAKTSLVCAIASKLNITFLSISAAAIFSPYVGDAERTISQLFRRARLSAPSVLFIDEIDALVGNRGVGMHKVSESVLSTLLTEMDGVGVKLEKSIGVEESFQPKVVVVAATNRPNLLDPALVRPGRFDRLVYVGPPDRNERLDILQKLTKKIPLGPTVDLEELAAKTFLFSGADLSHLCKEAALLAMCEGGMLVDSVEQSHWLKALDSMEPSLSQEQIDSYSTICFR
ncbi:hypothetical protein LSTR_LSTR000366 [Laodelphax striatellus]|uniref:AAA+ ATPase domain-containing protein n=1 Tax=Laodelphax striatellus TaxID=195883 RepID=A0A482X3V5_LAOST|nr:hypothetical protein LSTR_LSTR000366 [Laodelphax striatellus]